MRSPFRDDKRAGSFSIYGGQDGVSRWKDFATGEHGDCIDFAAKALGVSTGDAIRTLREMAGDELPPVSAPSSSSAPACASEPMLNTHSYQLSYLMSTPESARC